MTLYFVDAPSMLPSGMIAASPLSHAFSIPSARHILFLRDLPGFSHEGNKHSFKLLP